MPSYILTALAEDDMLDIWAYIAADNMAAADNILDQLEDRFNFLMDNPYLGPARPDIAEGLRYFPMGSYLVLYRIVGQSIEIVRVIHGARDLKDLGAVPDN
jgi:toxin ParE1/3/4